MIGLKPGHDADFIVIDPHAKPLLARRWQQADSDEARLFALIVLADDRNIHRTVIRGQVTALHSVTHSRSIP